MNIISKLYCKYFITLIYKESNYYRRNKIVPIIENEAVFLPLSLVSKMLNHFLLEIGGVDNGIGILCMSY